MANYEGYLGVVILLLFFGFAGYADKKLTGSWISPFNIVFMPYVAVVTIINLGGVHFGFYSVSLQSIFFVILSGLFFLFGRTGVTLLTKKYTLGISANVEHNNQSLDDSLDRYKLVFIVFAVISIVASIINFTLALKEVGGLFFIGTKEFEDAYGKGLLSHISQLNRPAFMFLIASFLNKKNLFVLLLLILMFISVLALQIKTHIISMFMSGVFFTYLLGLLRINIKKLLLYGLAIFMLFNISYTISYSRVGFENAYSGKVQMYLLNHFFAYLFGGPIGFSEVMKIPSYPLFHLEELFAVPLNIYNKFYSGIPLVEVIIKHWLPISTHYRYFHSSNVFTMFGTLYIYLGVYGTMLVMLMLGFVTYFVYYFSLKKTPWHSLKMIYAFYLSFLLLSFFGLYFHLLPLYYTTSLILVLSGLTEVVQTIINKCK